MISGLEVELDPSDEPFRSVYLFVFGSKVTPPQSESLVCYNCH